MAQPTVTPAMPVGTMKHLSALIRANVPIIWVVTSEEQRFMADFAQTIAEPQKRELWAWSAYQGLIPYNTLVTSYNKGGLIRASGEQDKSWAPNVCLECIDTQKRKSTESKGWVYILRDFNSLLQGVIPRQLRDMYQGLINQQKTIIILSSALTYGSPSPRSGIEPSLEKQMVVINYDLPDRETIEQHIRTSIANFKTARAKNGRPSEINYSDDEYRKFSIALQGLTEQEVDNAVSVSLCEYKGLFEKHLLSEKKQIIQRSEILEYIGIMPSLDEVGGLDAAKKYLTTYNSQFSAEAQAYGVEPLRGILLVGTPGCGKSLLAKAVAACWSLPLLRLDVGKVMGGVVGASESNMRQVINQVEAIAPAVLWIDEIEKSLSGTKSSNFSDGGTLARVFGTLLTAMEERMQGVVTIATANDIQALPPELIRRFNEVLFVDLPMGPEREEIFKIHLKARKRDPEKLQLDMAKLVKVSDGYTGSEIEKVVKEAVARAFQAHKPDVTMEELVGAVQDTKPISKVMGEKIKEIRDWAKGKARYASSLAEAEAMPGHQKIKTVGGKELNLGEALNDLDEVALPSNTARMANAAENVDEPDGPKKN